MNICTSCPLSSTRQVAGRGPSSSKIIVVGEFPDKSAEAYGTAFHPGKKDKPSPCVAIHRALEAIGLDLQKDVFWTYALRCNPYKKAKSVRAGDVKTCKHNLNLEVADITAPIVVAMGPVAVQSVLEGQKGGVTGNRLGWHSSNLGNRSRTAMVTLSPNQLDRNSLYTAREEETTDKKGDTLVEVFRDKRWNVFGSGPWFFKQDMFKLRDKLEELNLV